MKNSLKILSAVLLSTTFLACNSNQKQDMAGDSTSNDESGMTTQTEVKVIPGSYRELNTGNTVYIISDPQTGWAIDSISRVPVEFYIDNSGDTLFQTGLVVNHVIMKADGKWMLDETKIKRDGNEIKIKFPDGDKIKIDGDEMKIKDEDGKIKIGDDTMKVKPNN